MVFSYLLVAFTFLFLFKFKIILKFLSAHFPAPAEKYFTSALGVGP
jgi:hypothetical protein